MLEELKIALPAHSIVSVAKGQRFKPTGFAEKEIKN
jgi:hypothetical protein